jgi:pimeloyl-ACP methyl ester carboxylesterase
MLRITSHGAELATLCLGAASALPPMVMLHGLVFGSMASWYAGIALPLSVERQVILYDQRGHGDSTLGTAGFDLAAQAQDLARVLDETVPGRPVDLVGHSMGALIALHYALAHPQRVARLVLVDAPMPACTFIAPSLLQVDGPQVLEAFISRHLADAAPLGRRRTRLAARLQQLFFGSSLVADVVAMQGESPARLAQLDVPVTLIYGRRSPCLAAADTLRGGLPRTHLVLLDAGHYLPEEAPADLLHAVRGALYPATAAPVGMPA